MVVYIKWGVFVFFIDVDFNVYLMCEFYYVVGRLILEVVSGGIEGE